MVVKRATKKSESNIAQSLQPSLYLILVMLRVTATERDEIWIRQRGATKSYIEVRCRERRGRRSRISLSPWQLVEYLKQALGGVLIPLGLGVEPL